MSYYKYPLATALIFVTLIAVGNTEDALQNILFCLTQTEVYNVTHVCIFILDV